MISTSLLRSIQVNISNSNFTSTSSLVPFHILPGTTPPIPPMVTTEFNSSGQYFVRRWTSQQPHSDSNSIYSLSINLRPYEGPIFDANGKKINWPIGQMLLVIILLIVFPILIILGYFNNTIANTRIFKISSMLSVIAATVSSRNPGQFRQSTMTKSERENGYILWIDSWVDTSYCGKHAYVYEFF